MKKIILMSMLLFIVGLSSSFKPETRKRFTLKGQVVSNNQKLNDVDIIIYENGKKLRAIRTSNSGETTIKLKYNTIYNIFYYKIGYITKEVIVNTKGLKRRKNDDFLYSIELKKITKFESVDKKIVAAIIQYNTSRKSFDYQIPNSTISQLSQK